MGHLRRAGREHAGERALDGDAHQMPSQRGAAAVIVDGRVVGGQGSYRGFPSLRPIEIRADDTEISFFLGGNGLADGSVMRIKNSMATAAFKVNTGDGGAPGPVVEVAAGETITAVKAAGAWEVL